MTGDGGADTRRQRYERLYAEFRDARRLYYEAQERGASGPELVRLRSRMLGLWERLATWQRKS